MALRIACLAAFSVEPGLDVTVEINNKTTNAPLSARFDRLDPNIMDGATLNILPGQRLRQTMIRSPIAVLEVLLYLEEAVAAFALGVGVAHGRQ